MGKTKTICQCRGRDPKGPYEETRLEVIDGLREYLDDEPCVPGTTNETLPSDPVATGLAQVYTIAVARVATAVERKDYDDATAYGVTCFDIIRELLQLSTMLPQHPSATRVPTLVQEHQDAHRRGLQDFADRYIADNSVPPSRAREVADLLGKSYCKALAELTASINTGQVGYILHHSMVVSDLITEMTDMVVLRTDLHSEEILPKSDPIRIAAQEKIDVSDRR